MIQTMQLPTDREPVIRIIPMPKDTNPNGDIFGGWIMSHVDLAGSIVAAARIRGRMATVAVNRFTFKHPVYVGDLVSIYGSVERTGNTSLTVYAEVFVQRSTIGEFTGEVVRVTDASLTYVALDENDRPTPIPTLD
ncbi:MAG: putative acyl-CoA thioester hydrolase [Gammaproteobacteria bacterium]|nr:putative acyl-CoA thioester hydrolase [Gammaproteobacteria bacterium]